MFMLHCGIDCWDETMELSDVLDYRYLASIWTIRLFIRCCDICKDLRLEIPVIYSRYLHFWTEGGKLEMYHAADMLIGFWR